MFISLLTKCPSHCNIGRLAKSICLFWGFFVRKKEAVVFTDKVHVHNLKVVFFFLVNSIIIVAVTVIYFGVVGEKLVCLFFSM